MSGDDVADIDSGTVSPFGSAKRGLVLGVILGTGVALFEIATNFESILQALGGILILGMIGAIVGMIASLPLTIGYNLLVVALGGGKNASST